ncbi:DUF504 domain-containing protein [Fervidicoccus fontis]|uniref:Uncharacterized protein n=1 Tax=Fervidicoccus fontis (strain DSM 19380 / JCM 18336 / VKM B-2539 / Kam940) TaxID=1163730 RepID=H9ZZT1_FERFK|nr:DUF504 domain-containing protein [Fervidicoccus fontis]AFH42238.1 hypothetical protein FFONT_0247 [Fervidicoccus fontis Kam940]
MNNIYSIVKKALLSKEKKKYVFYALDRKKSTLREIRGNEITDVNEFGFLILLDGSQIPIHRIRKITFKGEVILERKG